MFPMYHVQEINVPLNATRYRDLIPVSVSDESFQKLTFKPRKARTTKCNSETGPDAPREPQVTDLYPTTCGGLQEGKALGM